MVLGIAVLPLAASHWWEPNRNKLLVSIVLGLPVLVLYVVREPSALVHMAEEYVSFIVLLAALYVISGGILMRGDLLATPLVNSAFLATGSVLASFIGTTGASMLLIRALLQTNRERTRVRHTVIFFIFLVSNIGGMLTPLGDPPLFLGHLQGVPFTWTFRLWPHWALQVVVLLALYFVWDTRQYTREPIAALRRDRTQIEPLRRRGARRARACAVFLGERDPFVVPRQCADLPGLPGTGPGPRPGQRGRGCPPRDPGGDQRGGRVHGGQQLHRQRAQLHGEVDRRGAGRADAELLRLHALQRRRSHA